MHRDCTPCFRAARLGTEAQRGARRHLLQTEGAILGASEAGGDRCCFTSNSELCFFRYR